MLNNTFDPHFMEIINGSAALMALWVMFFFGRYIITEWLKYRDRWMVAGAVSIFTVFTGHLMLRGSIWIQRHLENSGYGGFDWHIVGPILAAGALILMLGSACTIRVFAPDGTGWKWAIVAVVSSLGVSILLAVVE